MSASDVLPPEPPEDRAVTGWEQEHLIDPRDDAESLTEATYRLGVDPAALDAVDEYVARIRAELMAAYWERQYDLACMEITRLSRRLDGVRDGA